MTVTCTQAPSDHKGETEIQGRVTRDGAPVGGAYVRLAGAGSDFVGEIRSNDAGGFRFFLAPGEWDLVCLAPGAAREQTTVKLDKGDKLAVEFQLVAGPNP